MNESASSPDKAGLTSDMETRCGILPITETMQTSIIDVVDCSCTRLKAVIENELASCISSGQIDPDSLFTDQTTSWGCTQADVVSAMAGCGFGVRGCG